MSDFPNLERELDTLLKNILHSDLSKFKDVHAFKTFVERKITDVVLHSI